MLSACGREREAALAQSLSMNLVHLVYSTKHREELPTAAVRPKLFAYQAGVFRKWDSPAVVIGGVADHVHALFVLSKKHALSKVVEEVKKASSKWIKTQGDEFSTFRWQNGYGAFSIGNSQVERLRLYIERQEEHHRTTPYQEEFRKFLKRYGVEWDERYVWD